MSDVVVPSEFITSQSSFKNMEFRTFGNTSLKVSALALGTAPIGSRTDKPTSLRTLESALDQGINFYDTAPSYGQGSSEVIIGEAFRNKRDQVIIATKVGHSVTPILRFAAQFKPLVRSILNKVPSIQKVAQRKVQTFVQSQTKTDNFEAAYIIRSVEESLRRLKTDYIDLLLLHSPPFSVIQDGDAFQALDRLMEQGKIRYYGISTGRLDDTIHCLKNKDYNISAIQVTLNLYEQGAIDNLLPLTLQRGIACIAREPFAHGKLVPQASRQSGLSYLGPLASDEYFQFLTEGGIRTLTQAALQFILQTKGIATVLAGMSQARHVQQNADVFNLPHLSFDLIQKARLLRETLTL